jgi:hypothetical protein
LSSTSNRSRNVANTSSISMLTILRISQQEKLTLGKKKESLFPQLQQGHISYRIHTWILVATHASPRTSTESQIVLAKFRIL